MGGFAPLTDVTTGRASHWNAKNGRAQVDSSNITNKIREAFEVYMPNVAGSNWTEVQASGDLTYSDGNAAAASYLVVSKNPLVAGQQTTIESTFTFTLPVEFAFGVSMSQRTLGQEFSIEIVDTGDLLPIPADLAIASITQATTTLTVETTTAHGLSVGQAIGIRDCSNQLANYPALVVATTPSPVVFTVTAGPGGTIASQTITNPAGAKGFVYFRERLGRAQNGISQIFENTTATNSSLYIRSESGDALPSGTVAGNQSVTIGTTASVQLAGAVAYQYSFSPTNEYRMLVQSDRTQWADAPVDTTTAMTSRLVRTQICPDPSTFYKLRIRAVNAKSLTAPNAQIVSAVKSASTTATITTDVPHGLVTSDLVVIYGIRAQGAAEFPNLTTATAVTVTGPTTFTVTIGTSGTITSYGGYVAKVQGGNLMSALGAVAQVVQTVSMQTLPGGIRQLAIVGSAAWAGVAIGDLANLVGVRDNVTGATLNLDAIWKVANVSGSNLFLVPPSLEYTPPVAYPANTLGTTIDAASNGLALPQATITVASTAGYPASGTFWVQTTTGWQLITYTGTTATTFTGCTGGTGTLFTGQPVFGVTAAGGAAIRRTDLRVSFVRLFDYERERVEVLARPAGDIAASIPVTVNNTPAVTVSSGTITTVSTVTTITGGPAAEDAAAGTSPLTVGGVVRTAVAPTTLVAGDAARLTMTAGAACQHRHPAASQGSGWRPAVQLRHGYRPVLGGADQRDRPAHPRAGSDLLFADHCDEHPDCVGDAQPADRRCGGVHREHRYGHHSRRDVLRADGAGGDDHYPVGYAGRFDAGDQRHRRDGHLPQGAVDDPHPDHGRNASGASVLGSAARLGQHGAATSDRYGIWCWRGVCEPARLCRTVIKGQQHESRRSHQDVAKPAGVQRTAASSCCTTRRCQLCRGSGRRLRHYAGYARHTARGVRWLRHLLGSVKKGSRKLAG
jgi:hypothetical protein